VVVTVCGLAAGALTGTALAQMLTKVLTGVFDPPPDVLTVPWLYLAVVGSCAVAALGVAAVGAARVAGRAPLTVLREL
jgi:putative ABC transport system permease protein